MMTKLKALVFIYNNSVWFEGLLVSNGEFPVLYVYVLFVYALSDAE